MVLGLTPGADETEIKSAYRRLAKKYHPDLYPGDQRALGKFREICEAYDKIRSARSDGKPQKPEWEAFTKRNPPKKNAAHRSQESQPRKSDDFLSDLFGIKGFQTTEKAKYRSSRTRNTEAAIEDKIIRLSFEDAALGVERRIRLADGSVFDAKIPAGVSDGQRIRLRSARSEPRFDEIDGDLSPEDVVFEVKVDDHPYFKRKGFNVHMELPVTIDEAVLGSKVEVPTLDGPVILKIPPGSNGDTIFRLRGKGSQIFDPSRPINRDKRGDQYINLKVILPDSDDKQFFKLVKKWAARNSYSVRQHLQSAEPAE